MPKTLSRESQDTIKDVDQNISSHLKCVKNLGRVHTCHQACPVWGIIKISCTRIPTGLLTPIKMDGILYFQHNFSRTIRTQHNMQVPWTVKPIESKPTCVYESSCHQNLQFWILNHQDQSFCLLFIVLSREYSHVIDNLCHNFVHP